VEDPNAPALDGRENTLFQKIYILLKLRIMLSSIFT